MTKMSLLHDKDVSFSVKPTSSKLPSSAFCLPIGNNMPKAAVPLTYLNNLLAASICDFFGLPINLLISPTLNDKFSLLLHKNRREPTIYLNMVSSTSSSFSLFTSFWFTSIGLLAELHIVMPNLSSNSLTYFF